MEKIRDTLFVVMTKEETPIYEPKMNIFLEHIDINIWVSGQLKRSNNKQFNEKTFQKLLKDVRFSSYTLTLKRGIETVGPIGLESRRSKNGGTMVRPFIACNFDMWNSMQYRYEVLKCFMSSRFESDIKKWWNEWKEN